MMTARVNGEDARCIDALDRGLQFGDGLFETLALDRGAPRFIDWHIERLADGARRLGIPLPDAALLRGEIAAAAPAERAVVKLILTRGAGERGYRPPRHPQPTRIVLGFPWPAWHASAWTDGVRVAWCRTRLGSNPGLAGIKHLNRLEQVLARREWDDEAVAEGLMMDAEDRVISGTQTNLFASIAGRWITPALDRCGVAGVMRRAFMAWSAEQGETVIERPLPAAELAAAAGLVLTNALIGAWPVRELAGRAYAVDPRADRFNAWVGRQ
ncbi:MAG: aminodeoxychorismate lyase [Steroidobacteraceae bacterium]